ncbi:MAG TPA: MFS transporter [Burkholderiales bacterium]|nr:MFS transporter [Burkholderiales bacterium]
MTTSWTAVWVLFLAGLTAGAQLTKVPPALPAMRAELGLTLIESGLVQTMLYIVGAAVAVFIGVLADRFGQKRAALAGLCLMTLGGVLGALAPGYAALLFSRALEGIGFVLVIVGATPLVAAVALPSDRPTAFALWSAYMPAGGTLALLLAPLALEHLGWRSLWIALAALTAACAVLLLRLVPPAPFGGRTRPLRLLAESLGRPGALALCAVFICYVGQWNAVMTWLPTFAVEERGASAGTAALLTAGFVAINIPGTFLGGLLLRLGASRASVLAGGAAAMACAAAGLLAAGAPDGLRFASALAFSLLGGVIPAAVFAGTAVHAKSPDHFGTMNGMIMQSSHLSQFVVPILVAWTATHAGGWSASLGTMLALAGAGIVGALAVGRYEPEPR